ncbi:olfactory receptor 9K2-like [Trichosurus vulpecula]|uniref:olfactory receptor 9K2-like n=1 Tax=Trichosurus vulpecula TaxID=9337 RepID=UPI00186AD0A5|nr:olfactory receptor 9K2-like [Trichosurus vulpecula]
MKGGVPGNSSAVTEFILLGFRVPPEFQIIVFLVFLLIYMVIVVGNIGTTVISKIDSQLHTPVYFFLRKFSYLDFFYSTVIAPKTLTNFLSTRKTISYNGCATQFFFFSFFVTAEGFLLAVMTYDYFTAICSPLLYPVHMSQQVCIQLVAASYFCGYLNSIVQTGFTFSLQFCGEKRIGYFFCDISALIKISCTDTFVNDIVLFILSAVIIITTSLMLLVSYSYNLTTILNIPSIQGRCKTFSTCGSHIAVVSLFYGTVFFISTGYQSSEAPSTNLCHQRSPPSFQRSPPSS